MFAPLRPCSSAAGTRQPWTKCRPILRDKLGPAIGMQTYKAYRDVLESDRWQRLENLGARPQRLLFASTGTKDPKASDVLYIGALAAPNTVDTMPEETLLALSRSTAASESRFRVTVAIANKFWQHSPKPESTYRSWPPICSRRVRSLLSIHGKICWVRSSPKAKH